MESTKVYSRTEMREMMMDTSEYFFMDESGDFVGTLEMKAEARAGMLRLFLRLSDNRKIITPVFWWQRYLGFYEMETEQNSNSLIGKAVKIKSSCNQPKF